MYRSAALVNAPASSSLDRPPRPAPADRVGFLLGIGAYALWGVLPIYFKLVRSIAPVTIVAHRLLWSFVVLVLLVGITRSGPAVRAALAHRRTLALLAVTSALIAVNWLLYVYAVNNGHILAGSLGYYLNPIANILLGRFLLKEHLSRLQWAAVAIAAVGIAVLAAGALSQLWISLLLCASFASYGFIRKVIATDALSGLAIETAILFPFALGWLMFTHVPGAPLLAPTAGASALLLFSGVLTTAPLLMFTVAARRLPYSTLGMLQFIAPTTQLLLAVFLYGEPFTRSHAIAFAAIWTALALYIIALAHTARRERLASAADDAMMR